MAIRENLEQLSPRWLRNFNGVRLIYVVGLHVDRLLEKMLEGSVAHMPGIGTPTALYAIGAARKIIRGITETDASYASRLRVSWDSWGLAGSNRGVLVSVLGTLLQKTPGALIASEHRHGFASDDSIWDTYQAGDDFQNIQPSHAKYNLYLNWDSEPVTSWWRCFLVIYSLAPNQNWTAPAKWGSGGKWGDGRAWGCNESSAQGTAVNAAIQNTRAAHGWFQWWMVAFDGTFFQTVLPDGTWGRWSKIVNGQYVPSRSNLASYANGPGLEYP